MCGIDLCIFIISIDVNLQFVKDYVVKCNFILFVVMEIDVLCVVIGLCKGLFELFVFDVKGCVVCKEVGEMLEDDVVDLVCYVYSFK